MDQIELISDAARRPLESARAVLADITDETLHAMPGGGNSIAWLVWHAARQQDSQVASLRGRTQLWDDGWAEKLGVSRGPDDFGFGDTPEEVAALRVRDAGELLDYLAAVVEDVVAYFGELAPEELDDVVDDSWDPPVTRGVRLVSTIDDTVAHVAQAAYARGLAEGWRIGY